MLSWIRRFFYSDDEIIRLADGLSEYDATQYKELLTNAGIGSMTKNMSALFGNYGGAGTWANDHALLVKQSDVEVAVQVLDHLIARHLTDEAIAVRKRLRQSPP